MIGDVCWVNPDGTVECTNTDETSIPDALRAQISTLLTPLRTNQGDDAKFHLLVELACILETSQLPDVNIARRSKPIQNALHLLLAADSTNPTLPARPRSVLLFDFDTTAAEQLGPYVLVKRGLAGVQNLYNMFTGKDPW